jgi:sulfite reductase alpha subunit-like flavoprotein
LIRLLVQFTKKHYLRLYDSAHAQAVAKKTIKRAAAVERAVISKPQLESWGVVTEYLSEHASSALAALFLTAQATPEP